MLRKLFLAKSMNDGNGCWEVRRRRLIWLLSEFISFATVLSDIKILIQHSKRAQWAWYAIPWLPSVISRSVILWGRWICLTYLIWSSYFPDIPCNVFVGVSRKFRMLCCQHLNRAASRFAQQCHNLSGHLSSLEPNNYAYKFSNLNHPWRSNLCWLYLIERKTWV